MWSPPRLRPAHVGRVPVVPTDDLLSEPARSARTRVAARPAAERGEDEIQTVEFAYSRGELQPVLKAIRDTLGCGAVPLDTPARLQDALTSLIRSVSGSGDPTVRRSPAALLTPEYWHIRLDATDRRTLAILSDVVGRRTTR